MTTKELTRRQARWAETLGCFDFDIVFRPGRQLGKPDALSRRPDLAPEKGSKLSFGQILRPENISGETFTEIAEFDCWFEEEYILDEEAESWFEIDVLGVDKVELPDTSEWTDRMLVESIRQATPHDKRLGPLLNHIEEKDEKRGMTTREGIIYEKGIILVPAVNNIKREILRSRHDSKMVGHPGRARTLALVKRVFSWPSMKKFINDYVDGCQSCQRVKPSTQVPFGTLEPLPIPAGPWTDISYDMITDLPVANSFDAILTVVDRLTKMSHFLACRKNMNSGELADLLLKNVWKLHRTPKTIISDRGSVFISQVTRELDKRLGIKLHPSTVYHPRTDGQSEIANKAVEQYIRHFVNYHQNNWDGLLATAEFAYNNNTHTSIGVSPFKANYGFDPCLGGIPSAEQCVPEVEQRLKALERVQEELRYCLEESQESMKIQFDKHVKTTPRWAVGDEVWLSSRNITTARPTAKLEHRWLGPFPISKQISTSAYQLTLPLSMHGIHPVFHVSVLRKHTADSIEGRGYEEPAPVQIEDEDEWEVGEILNCRKKRKKKEYLIAWKGYGPEANSWEPETNLSNSEELLDEFNKKFPTAAAKYKRTKRRK
ncbi:hypothetical protein Pst134EA_033220 [Puccinia striiformis f. sp. tritici]|uniref:hypothetical protein n=1 Tax=Puccinia striiformis f. sp. tritici TaxID=168172 RepID=UPI002008C888|nr:hypothetical protein Pst134EA_033220 [Puccinia striiformis f. sp. tritici]KAH9473218.1 hypothetical protein Pst134EA_033220 [Puccinia striiformis f. sp. tritici]